MRSIGIFNGPSNNFAKMRKFFRRQPKNCPPEDDFPAITPQSLNKTAEIGFPSSVRAFAHDPALKLLAFASDDGILRLYGAESFQIRAPIAHNCTWIGFLVGQGRIIVIDSNIDIVIYAVTGCCLEVETRLLGCWSGVVMTAVCVSAGNDRILAGFEGRGNPNLSIVDLGELITRENVEYRRDILPHLENFSFDPSNIEVIAENPAKTGFYLLGFRRGLVVHFKPENREILNYFLPPNEVESLSWANDGISFICGHSNGTITEWGTENGGKSNSRHNSIVDVKTSTPVRQVKRRREAGNWVCIFCGGRPSQSLSVDSITIHDELSGKNVVIHSPANIVGFALASSAGGFEDVLIVVTRQEMFAVDLEEGKNVRIPYLNCIHTSEITACSLTECLSGDHFALLGRSLEGETRGKFSTKEWPIDGFPAQSSEISSFGSLVITGHENGSIRFWHVREDNVRFIGLISTEKYFYPPVEDKTGDEGWEKIWNACSYDPCCDDPRLAIATLVYCEELSILVAGTAAGIIFVTDFASTANLGRLSVPGIVGFNILVEDSVFQWKGHKPLKLDGGCAVEPSVLSKMYQVYPPARIVTLSVKIVEQQKILMAGTKHGFVVIDLVKDRTIYLHTTLNIHDMHKPTQRRQLSMFKSLRETLKKCRTFLPTPERGAPDRGNGAVLSESKKSLTNFVTTSYFSEIKFPLYLDEDDHHSYQTFWTGTNRGKIFAYQVGSQYDMNSLSLWKKIQLKHGSAVVDLAVIPYRTIGNVSDDSNTELCLYVCTEQQIRLYGLPKMKLILKKKIFAEEGAGIKNSRRIVMKNKKNVFMLMGHDGKVSVYTGINFVKIYEEQCINANNLLGINFSALGSCGGLLYLESPSFMRYFRLEDKKKLKN